MSRIRTKYRLILTIFVAATTVLLLGLNMAEAVEGKLRLQCNSAQNSALIAKVPPDSNIVAFEQAGQLWIVMDSSIVPTINCKVKKNSWLRDVKQVWQSEYPSMTFVTATLSPKQQVEIIRANDNIKIVPKKGGETGESTVKVTLENTKTEVELAVSPARSISYTDLYTGEKIDLFFGATLNSSSAHDFHSFRIMQSAGGIVLQEGSDILVNISENLLTITDRTLPELAKLIGQYSSANLDFNDQLNAINSQKSEKKWLKLATLYFVQGWYEEAYLALQMSELSAPNPDAEWLKKILMALGNKNSRDEILIHKSEGASGIPEEVATAGIEDGHALDVKGVEVEEAFWQKVSGCKQLGTDTACVDVITALSGYRDNFLSKYPENLRKNLLFLVLDSAYAPEPQELSQIIDELSNVRLTKHEKNRLEYYQSMLAKAQRDRSSSDRSLTACLKDVSDLRNYVQCSIAQLTLNLQQKRISENEYLEQLKLLSFVWRRDPVEVELAMDIADVAYKRQDYKEAIRWWSVISKNYWLEPAAINASSNVGKAFIAFFDDSRRTPFEVVDFFQEFREFLPIGETGEAIVQKVVDDLIALELLNQAADLLEYQIVHQLRGGVRTAAVDKLAELYLAMGQATQALACLEREVAWSNQPVSGQRVYLYGRILSEMGKYEEALKLLPKDDLSLAADRLRADIYWHLQDWRSFSDYSEPYLYSIRYGSGLLKADDSYRVVKQMLAYLYLKEYRLLSEMHQDFRDRFADVDRDKAFGDALQRFGEFSSRESQIRSDDVEKLREVMQNFMK